MRAVALGVVLAAVCAWAAPLARGEAGLPALRARFEIKHPDGRTEHLELLRTDNLIEHHFVERGVRESWQRDARGELEHVRAFPDDGKSVHYTAGDLRTIQLAPEWRALETLLGQRELESLREVGKRAALDNRRARVLTGTLRGKPARVSWLDDIALPAQLALGAGKTREVISLISVSDCAAHESCQPASLKELRSIEFADLGDMENDPFVRRYLATDRHHH